MQYALLPIDSDCLSSTEWSICSDDMMPHGAQPQAAGIGDIVLDGQYTPVQKESCSIQ